MTAREVYCTCGDPVVPGKHACAGCLLDRAERDSLREGGGPMVQWVTIKEAEKHSCPWCGEQGFDLVDLKRHLENCEAYNKTDSVHWGRVW